MFRETIRGEFVERLNRFLALVEVDGRDTPCFLPNPGRMEELLIPGGPVLLKPAENAGRKTAFDLVAVEFKGRLVSVDSRIPNKVMAEALESGTLPEFRGYTGVIPEYSYHTSRFDFLLRGRGRDCLMEVKSCTLVKDGVALFPDAPTERGKRHVKGLIRAKEEGFRSCIVFVVQRDDAALFSPNSETDPAFSKALKEAHEKGVEILAYSCLVDSDGIGLDRSIPIRIP
jgi:sugar fermentation stimulation protein A